MIINVFTTFSFLCNCKLNRNRHIPVCVPRFSIVANLCRSAGFFLQGSAKIVALNLEDPYRSERSLQKCADFLKDFFQKYVFLLLRNQNTAFLDFFNYFIQHFS